MKHIKRYLPIFVAMLILGIAGCARPYVEGGLMIHSQTMAKPEVQFPSSSLGYAEAGVEKQGWSFFIRHLSDPSTFEEEGYGINSVGVSKRVYLFD